MKLFLTPCLCIMILGINVFFSEINNDPKSVLCYQIMQVKPFGKES